MQILRIESILNVLKKKIQRALIKIIFKNESLATSNPPPYSFNSIREQIMHDQ